jgi:hypothetical protein
LETEAGTVYGFLIDEDAPDPFPVDAPNQFVGLESSALSLSITSSQGYGTISSVFELGNSGIFATRNAEVQYLGVGVSGSIDFYIYAQVCQYYLEDPVDVVLNTCILASNRDSVLDNPPFVGIDGLGRDQERFCDPSLRKAFEFDWNFGRFVVCRSTDCVRIFFPYVPKVFDTGFYAGVSFVNQGVVDLDTVDGHIYESDGSHWTVDFGPLAVRHQRTLLLIDDGGTVGFDDMEGDDFLVPTSLDGDLVLGDLRSSMFIVGCQILDDLGAGGTDLDGYLLIGYDDFVSGSYTARNFEVSIYDRNPDQDGDLPVQYDKAGRQFAPVSVETVAPHFTMRSMR